MRDPGYFSTFWNYLGWPSSSRPTRPSKVAANHSLASKRTASGRITKSSKPPTPKLPTPPDSLHKPPKPPHKYDLFHHKRDGRAVAGGEALNPQHVERGSPNRFSAIRSTKSKGLQNPGNMCYRNAALQGLLHVPRFYRYLGKIHEDCRKRTAACTICALQNLAASYWGHPSVSRKMDVRGPTRAITDFNRACRANLPTHQFYLKLDFESEGQSDPHDFLVYLYNQLKTHDRKGIKDMFKVAHDNRGTCQECSNSFTEHDSKLSGWQLGIDVRITSLPEGNTLEEYLKEEMLYESRRRCHNEFCDYSDETLDEEDKVQEGSLHTIQYTITELPEVLVIRLMRYGHDKLSDGSLIPIREQRDVPLGEYLNLRRYTEGQDDQMYRLDGVVAHNGETLNSGHYIASVRQAEGFDFETINDNYAITQTFRGSFKEMLRPLGRDRRGRSFLPYLLIYSKM